MKNRIQLLFLFVLLIALDQFLKILFSENSACNKNIAWSIPVAPGIFYFVFTIIFFALFCFFLKSKRFAEKFAFIFVLSGAISNLVDRIMRGCVIDFINLKFWPVFNLADIYITMGIIILLIKIIKKTVPRGGTQ
ncbi:MAG: signal peptidase II [Patescibacteria group bacterium]|nr:signal peptidase II [Patescibacteria group bacterium]